VGAAAPVKPDGGMESRTRGSNPMNPATSVRKGTVVGTRGWVAP
jgi:hypothetical protein